MPLLGLECFHTILLSGATSNSVPSSPEQISVLPLGSRCAGDQHREELGLVRRRVTPDGSIGCECHPGFAYVVSCGIDRCDDFVD